MLISLNSIKKYVQIPAELSTEKLIEIIGSRLVEIEEVIDLAPKYKGVYIVKVVSAEKIPDTHLSLCQIDAGPHTAEFAEAGAETVQVVCGAPNVHAGMLAVWITPGSIVPSTYGNENFRLGKRKLQGYESNGMLAGADELGFDNEHKSIAEIDPKIAQPGDSLADVFDLNDTIIDVENKSLTHRPDCFGLIGFAREVAGILGQPFPEIEWPALKLADDLAVKVTITDSAICPRYSCAVFDLPDNQPEKYLTPTAVFLSKAGMRSIDPMVDLTNVMMLETGQPLHAFDYDKLVAIGQSGQNSQQNGAKDTPEIIVRLAQPGETIQLLDGKTIECTPEDILITSNNIPVALAGAMGGKNTEIDASTKRVVLESATFSLYNLRKTQMAHGIFSEAITRFTKGQPAAMTFPVLSETVARLGVSPLAVVDAYPDKPRKTVVKITTLEINQLLGTTYDQGIIIKTLENVNFTVSATGDTLEVTAPVWRTDIHIKEDIIEEVGRLLGYDNIPLALPEKPFAGTEVAPMLRLKSELRGILSDRLAMHEVLTYSFVSKALLEKSGQDPADHYEIVNSISPELQNFRSQIVPSLLDKIRENIKSGHRDFSLYELNQVSSKANGLSAEETPVLNNHLGIVCLGDFYKLKTYILTMLRRGLKVELEYSQLVAGSKAAETYPYLEPAHSAVLLLNGETIGAFGEIKAAVARRFKLETTVSACELDLDKIVDLPRRIDTDLKLSRFPSVERDLTLKVSADAQFGRVHTLLDQVLASENLIFETLPVSIYQSAPDSPTKNFSFHLKFSSPDKTLDQSDITKIMDKITVEVAALGAEIV
jgi:phenylalanyl-tRNA synthetase beta chain